MRKICTGCGQERDAEKDFNWKYKDRGVRHSHCRFCTSQHSKEHYQNNKQDYVVRSHDRNKRVYQENRERLCKYLTVHPCVDCGCMDIRVLEFDHVRGLKTEPVTRLLSDKLSWKTIEAEIAKCEVRCANCHRIKTGSTNDENASWRHFFDTLDDRVRSDRSVGATRKIKQIVDNQRRLYIYLSENPCVDCCCSDIRVLEFDHVRDTKYSDISRILTSGATWPRIEAEIAKCEVRCANCHRIKTSERGGFWRFGRS